MAGLGNQMLQYALGRHLSIQYNTPLWLDISWFDSYKDVQNPREFRLDCFRTHFRKVDLSHFTWKLRYTDRFKFLNPFKLKNISDRDLTGLENGVLDAGNNVLLEGFFQNYRYFESIRELLVKEFTPVEKMNAANANCLEHIKATNSVSVHFRRGDYALTNYHGMLDTSYYDDAIKLIAQKTGKMKLFIFSDDPEWVLQNMNFTHPFELINFNKDKYNYFDMELMKHCRHNIIANSTFSWWPAWLNENPGKIIVAPEKWLNLEQNRLENIPEGWILL